jgi:hypothetical protein
MNLARHKRRLCPAALIMALLAFASCGGDDPAEEPGTGASGGAAAEAEMEMEPPVSPAESAAAVVRLRSHADSVRRAARVKAGLPAVDSAGRPPAPTAPASAEEEYQACMSQARQAEGHTRTQIERACENHRRARAAEAA